MTVSYEQFVKKLSSCGLMTLEELQEFESSQLSSGSSKGAEELAQRLVRRYNWPSYCRPVGSGPGGDRGFSPC